MHMLQLQARMLPDRMPLVYHSTGQPQINGSGTRLTGPLPLHSGFNFSIIDDELDPVSISQYPLSSEPTWTESVRQTSCMRAGWTSRRRRGPSRANSQLVVDSSRLFTGTGASSGQAEEAVGTGCQSVGPLWRSNLSCIHLPPVSRTPTLAQQKKSAKAE